MAEWVKVAQAGEIQEGHVKTVLAKEQRLALAHLAGGTYHAIEDRCTHDNGPLGAGELVDDWVECPRHGARFNVKSGQPVTLPAVLPVKSFQVKVVGNDILVEL